MKKRTATMILTSAVLSVGGCLGDRAADRTITLYQLQGTTNYRGPFIVDTTQLPANAVERTETDNWGNPVTSLKIGIRYPVKIVLVPTTQP